MSWFRPVIAVALLALAACGFQPVYGERGALPRGAQTQLANVQILPIEERVGQMLRNVLLDQMNPGGMPAKPQYQLEVLLTESASESSVQKNQFSTRANLTLNATYSLLTSGTRGRVFQGTSTVTASYDILSQPYATLAAEADARARGVRELGDDITQRVAAFFANPPRAAQK